MDQTPTLQFSCGHVAAALDVALRRSGSAKKKPPERLCPRGAEDTILFRERLDAWPPCRTRRLQGRSTRPRRAFCMSEACRLHPCKRPNASRPAGWSPSRHAQVQAHPRGSVACFGMDAVRQGFLAVTCNIHEAARIGHFRFGVKAGFFPARISVFRGAGCRHPSQRPQYMLGMESVQPTTGTSGAMRKISTRRFFWRSLAETLGATG